MTINGIINLKRTILTKSTCMLRNEDEDIFVVMKLISLHIVMTAPAKMKFNNKHSADYFYGLTHKCCVHGSITSLSRTAIVVAVIFRMIMN